METDKGQVSVENGNYKSLKDDPEALLLLVDKYVKVQLIKNISFNGFLLSIDPITCSVILLVAKEDEFQTTLIPGHAIINVDEIPPGNIEPPKKRESTAETEEQITIRKGRLIAWFKWNLLPVSESGDTIAVQCVNILPPYTTSDIYAENPVVALQIRKMMEKMPQDFVADFGDDIKNIIDNGVNSDMTSKSK